MFYFKRKFAFACAKIICQIFILNNHLIEHIPLRASRVFCIQYESSSSGVPTNHSLFYNTLNLDVVTKMGKPAFGWRHEIRLWRRPITFCILFLCRAERCTTQFSATQWFWLSVSRMWSWWLHLHCLEGYVWLIKRAFFPQCVFSLFLHWVIIECIPRRKFAQLDD